MRNTRNTQRTTMGVALAAGMMTALLAPAPAAAQADKVIVMKLSTATINDTQHEWLKRFAALVEKDSGGRIKAEIYPASQLGSIPAPDRRRAVRLDPGLDGPARIPGRRR